MEPFPDRLPLVIGVTGHRDLRDEDVPKLEQEIAAILRALRQDYLDRSGETPVIILSSLAEGADRLVARVGLAEGAYLVAPMPMPIDEYRRDFEPGLKPGNAAEFESLLGQALAAPVVPFMPGNSLEAVRNDQAKRGEQYRAVGLYIAQQCNVLLALWDGDAHNPAAGGTAEVTIFKLRGFPLSVSRSARVSLDGSEIGPVIHVVTPRQKETSAAEAVSVNPWGRGVIKRYRGGVLRRALHAANAFIARMFARGPVDLRASLSEDERRALESWENFEAITGLTRQFNREAALLSAGADGKARMENSIADLFGLAGAPPGADAETARTLAAERAPRWCRMYAIADALAQVWQVHFRRDWLILLACGFFAFVCFTLFWFVGKASNLLLVLYTLSFVAIFVVFLRAHFGQHQGRFLDYRALAEALRVAVYWKLAGITEKHSGQHEAALPVAGTAGPRSVADVYPIKQTGELAWVKIALRVLDLVGRREQLAAIDGLDPAVHAIVRHHWVAGQAAFFRRRCYEFKHTADTLGTNAIVLSALAPFVIVPIVFATLPVPDETALGLRTILLIISGLLPGIAAVMSAYAERLAFNAQARQYDRMRMLFERGGELLPETIDQSTAPLAEAIYAELGAEAMKESAEWVAIYRLRPIQPAS